MVGPTKATYLCAYAHSEDGNLSVAVEWLSDFGRVVSVKFSNQTSLLQRNQTVVNISYMAGKFLSLCHGSFQRLNFKPKTPATGHVESCVQLEAASLLLPNSNLHLSGRSEERRVEKECR